jgi:hypothetical protein
MSLARIKAFGTRSINGAAIDRRTPQAFAENPVQVSAIPQPVQYTPVQQAQPVQPVQKDNDGDSDNGSGADDKVKSANPPGVGTLLDISA